jgi:hypothetical protein
MTKYLLIFLLIAISANCFGYYNPSQGRWLSRDPIGEIENFINPKRAGKPVPPVFESFVQWKTHQRPERRNNDMCLYLFSRNDSVNQIDYLGLLPCTEDEINECKTSKCPSLYPGAIITGSDCRAYQITLPLICTFRWTACNCQCNCKFILRMPWPDDPANYDKCYWSCPGFGGIESKVYKDSPCQGEATGGTSTDCAALKAATSP